MPKVRVWDNVKIIAGPFKGLPDAWRALQENFAEVRFPAPRTKRKYEVEKKSFSRACSCSRDDVRLRLDYVYDRRLDNWFVIFRNPDDEGVPCRCYLFLPNTDQTITFLYNASEKYIIGHTNSFLYGEAPENVKIEGIQMLLERSELEARPREFLNQNGIVLPEDTLMEVERSIGY